MGTFTREEIERKLSASSVMGSLLGASLFLTAYELLKSAIVDDVRSFYDSATAGQAGPATSEYKVQVLSLDSSVFRASCLWLSKAGAISDQDVESLRQIREYRNQVAHDLPPLLIDPSRSLDWRVFEKAANYLNVIGRFWARLEMSTDPAFDGRDVEDEDILSGRMAALQVIINALAAIRPREGSNP